MFVCCSFLHSHKQLVLVEGFVSTSPNFFNRQIKFIIMAKSIEDVLNHHINNCKNGFYQTCLDAMEEWRVIGEKSAFDFVAEKRNDKEIKTTNQLYLLYKKSKAK